MITESRKVLKIFYSYANEDSGFQKDLDKHLANMRRQGIIQTWHHRDVSAGKEWKKEVNSRLEQADIILLLVSADFMDSDYCWGVELNRALQKHHEGTTHVIPILIRSVDWKDAPFNTLQALPVSGLPVTGWIDRDKAFTEIVQGIRRVVTHFYDQKDEEAVLRQGNPGQLHTLKIRKQWMHEGDKFADLNQHDKALAAYKQALQVAPEDVFVHQSAVFALMNLGRYQEALSVCEQALKLNSYDAVTHNYKGMILFALKRYKDAIAAYSWAIVLRDDFTLAYNGKGDTFYKLKRYQEALLAYEKALELDSFDSDTWRRKGDTLYHLLHYKKALRDYQRALQIDNGNIIASMNQNILSNALKTQHICLVDCPYCGCINPDHYNSCHFCKKLLFA